MTRRRLTAAALAASTLFAFAGLTRTTQAKNKAPQTPLQLAVTGTVAPGGGTFSGTFTLQRFAVRDNAPVAVGFIRGSVTGADGIPLGSVLRGPVELPVAVSGGAAAAPGAVQQQVACDVLHLALGAVSLDVLGLQVTTAPIAIDIVASGEGTDVLGRLICTILETVGSVVDLVGLLNQLLGLVTGLLGGLLP